jgi:hypothetical protein
LTPSRACALAADAPPGGDSWDDYEVGEFKLAIKSAGAREVVLADGVKVPGRMHQTG